MELLAPTIGTRVLQSQVRAVLDVLPTAQAVARVAGRTEGAKVIAEAVVTAADWKTRWVVICEGLIYGPYASRSAAQRAIENGSIGTRPYPVPARISVLIPAPKKGRKK